MPGGLSVVIPFVNSIDDVSGALGALAAERNDVEIEALVVERLGESAGSEVRRRFPWATVVSVESNSTIPQMRAIAFRQALHESVAVIEDHVIVPRGWARALLAEQTEQSPVVGGAVVNLADGRLVDRAAFLCEYSHCLPPIAEGQVSWLTGNNVVYPKRLLERFREVVESGGWENRLHDAFRAAGIPLVCRPGITVGHKMHYSVGLYASQRYLYSRSYAGARSDGLSLAKRIAYAVATPALPALLMARLVSRVRERPQYRGDLVRSLPLISLFVVAWAAGELVGYLLGPGRSLSKVR
ncbi:MAG: hypothetical protein ACT4OZ_02495 [Gemmatimonadota bacterium]